jgi:hypothetical protein
MTWSDDYFKTYRYQVESGFGEVVFSDLEENIIVMPVK